MTDLDYLLNLEIFLIGVVWNTYQHCALVEVLEFILLLLEFVLASKLIIYVIKY